LRFYGLDYGPREEDTNNDQVDDSVADAGR
jgi:hypothetical protein